MPDDDLIKRLEAIRDRLERVATGPAGGAGSPAYAAYVQARELVMAARIKQLHANQQLYTDALKKIADAEGVIARADKQIGWAATVINDIAKALSEAETIITKM